MKNFKGYSLFNELKNRKLKAFNRLNTMMNLNNLLGEGAATEYVNHFSKEDKTDLTAVAYWIKKEGMEKVQTTIHKEAK